MDLVGRSPSACCCGVAVADVGGVEGCCARRAGAEGCVEIFYCWRLLVLWLGIRHAMEGRRWDLVVDCCAGRMASRLKMGIIFG